MFVVISNHHRGNDTHGCSFTSQSDCCVFYSWAATSLTPVASCHAPLAPLVWLVVVSPLVAPTPPVHRHLRLLPRCIRHLLPFSSGGHHPACLRNTGIPCLWTNVGRRGVRAEGGYQQGRRHLSPPSPLQHLIVVSLLLLVLSLLSVIHHPVIITSSSLSEPPPPSSPNRLHQLPLCCHRFLPPFVWLIVVLVLG